MAFFLKSIVPHLALIWAVFCCDSLHSDLRAEDFESGLPTEGWEYYSSSAAGPGYISGEHVLKVYDDDSLHTVTFDLGAYGTLLTGDLIQEIGEGYSAVAPEILVEDGWSFVGWDRAYEDVTGSFTVIAQYAPSDLVGILESKLTTSDGGASDYFGHSVSIRGDTALVGAFRDDDNGFYSGSVYAYVRIGGVWTEQGKLTASDGVAGDGFGRSVSLSGDMALIGAHGDDDNGYRSGSAYVYERSGKVWTEQDKLTASDGAFFDLFGRSVSLSGDTALIGASLDDDNGDQSGSAYVYVRSGNAWTEQGKLTASDGAAGDGFGRSVSLSGDTALIGAYRDDDNGDQSGSAYVYVRSGNAWTEQGKLTASDGAAGDGFGRSVSLSEDTALIGTYSSGSAYVYKRIGDIWVEQGKLTTSSGAAGNLFDRSVTIQGNTALVGGSGNNSVYVYTRNGGIWTERDRLRPSDGAADDYFGYSVSFSGDMVLVGAFSFDDSGDSSGSVYFYDLGVPPVEVTFDLNSKASRNGGGELNQLVRVGTPAIQPIIDLNPGWLFDQWDTDFSEVMADMTVSALYSVDPNDTDGDRILDSWEKNYFSNVGVIDDLGDFDGDGRNNYEEFVAGNNPNDRSDYFHVMEQAVAPVGGQITLRFTTNDDLTTRRYRIYYTDNLSTTDGWLELPMGAFAPDSGDSTEKTFDMPGAEKAYFFKIEAFIED